MQLTGPAIDYLRKPHFLRKLFKLPPLIVIEPFDINCLGSNSYDLHLDNKLRVYTHTLPKGIKPAIPYDKEKYESGGYSMRDWFDDPWLYEDYCLRPEKYDFRNPKFLLNPCDDKTHETIDITIPETGLILSPNVGYLGSTLEYTETRLLFPYIDGKSSLGRNFILNHHTAGRGDDGFCGQWTLEIKTLYPTVVFPNMRIGQIYYEMFIGKRKPYNKNKASHYNNQIGPTAAAPIGIEKSR